MEPLTDDKGTYRTGQVKVPLLGRLLPSVNFYPRMIYVVYMASRLCRRGKYDDGQWYASSTAILRALEKTGIMVEITGADNLKSPDGPCVFVSNHMSTLETFVLPAIIRPFKAVTFVVKKSLVEYPVFGHVMRSRDPVTVGRKNPREDLKAVLEGGTERLKAGISVVIFPQSTEVTRSTVFDPRAFNSIGVKLARRAGVPVVPIAVQTDAWGTGRILRDFGRIDPSKDVQFCFGEPMAVRDSGKEEHQKTVEFIRDKLSQWGRNVKELNLE
jgi:1-acyl-sn-glycerol-3-phosphate acyltransferase